MEHMVSFDINHETRVDLRRCKCLCVGQRKYADDMSLMGKDMSIMAVDVSRLADVLICEPPPKGPWKGSTAIAVLLMIL